MGLTQADQRRLRFTSLHSAASACPAQLSCQGSAWADLKSHPLSGPLSVHEHMSAQGSVQLPPHYS